MSSRSAIPVVAAGMDGRIAPRGRAARPPWSPGGVFGPMMLEARGLVGATCLAALALAGACQTRAESAAAPAAAHVAPAAPAYVPAARDGAQCRGSHGFAADFGGRRT